MWWIGSEYAHCADFEYICQFVTAKMLWHVQNFPVHFYPFQIWALCPEHILNMHSHLLSEKLQTIGSFWSVWIFYTIVWIWNSICQACILLPHIPDFSHHKWRIWITNMCTIKIRINILHMYFNLHRPHLSCLIYNLCCDLHQHLQSTNIHQNSWCGQE